MSSPLDAPSLIPFEDYEQKEVQRFCDDAGLDYWHTPNETYTESKNQKRINKLMGVKSGIPDLFIIVFGQLIAIEMKRCRGAKPATSKQQREWLAKLSACGIPARVCYGHEEAIEFIIEVAKHRGFELAYDDSPF